VLSVTTYRSLNNLGSGLHDIFSLVRAVDDLVLPVVQAVPQPESPAPGTGPLDHLFRPTLLLPPPPPPSPPPPSSTGFGVIMLSAVREGDAKKLADLMRKDPGFNVNLAVDGNGWTLLHHACSEDSSSAVIPLLLAHPDIDVNVKTNHGTTPFYFASGNGHTSCVRETLKDSRVKVNEPHDGGYTPLWWAASNGRLDIIKVWIASGREMDLGKPGDLHKTDAIGKAKEYGKTEVVTLLERFKRDAAKTRRAIRVELGWYDEAAAEIFAMVVFVSDGLLQVKDTTPSLAARFFSIAALLPLELQMVLCNRLVGSGKEIIPGKESEVAFKELARRIGS